MINQVWKLQVTHNEHAVCQKGAIYDDDDDKESCSYHHVEDALHEDISVDRILIAVFTICLITLILNDGCWVSDLLVSVYPLLLCH